MAAGGVETEIPGARLALDCDVSGGDAILRGGVHAEVLELVWLGVSVERPGAPWQRHGDLKGPVRLRGERCIDVARVAVAPGRPAVGDRIVRERRAEGHAPSR